MFYIRVSPVVLVLRQRQVLRHTASSTAQGKWQQRVLVCASLRKK